MIHTVFYIFLWSDVDFTRKNVSLDNISTQTNAHGDMLYKNDKNGRTPGWPDAANTVVLSAEGMKPVFFSFLSYRGCLHETVLRWRTSQELLPVVCSAAVAGVIAYSCVRDLNICAREKRNTSASSYWICLGALFSEGGYQFAAASGYSYSSYTI